MATFLSVIALGFLLGMHRFTLPNRGLGTVSGLVSVCFGLFVVYQMGFVNGLFGHSPNWVPR